MALRPFVLALSTLPVALMIACADPPTFVLAEGTTTETAETQPPVVPATPSTEAPTPTPTPTPSTPDAATPPPAHDASAPVRDGGKGKGKDEDDDDD